MRGALADLASLLVPSTLILFFLSRESVSVVLQTGLFTHQSSLLTAHVLRGYLIFMTPLAFYALMLRLGYSAGRYWTMTIVVLIQNLLDILLMWIFITQGVGILSLPLANGVAAIIGFIILAVLLRDLYAPLLDRALFTTMGKIALANLYQRAGLTWYESGSNLTNLLILALLGIASVAIVLASYALMKIPLTAIFKRGGGGSVD